MPSEEDDFEDAREHGIDPAFARKAHQMYRRWHDIINDEFPDALLGDPEQRDIIMNGAAALLGELAGLVWVASSEELARDVLQRKCNMASRKMDGNQRGRVTRL